MQIIKVNHLLPSLKLSLFKVTFGFGIPLAGFIKKKAWAKDSLGDRK